MDESKTMKWGMIGCGSVTELKSGPAYQKVDGIELHGVWSRTSDKAVDYARRHGVPETFPSAEALIASPDIDGVYVATPPDTHEYYALKVAEAGKPCCVEKPLAHHYESAKAIVDSFHSKDLPLFVAYYRRSLPRFSAIKNWLDEGRIGHVVHVHWELTKPPNNFDIDGASNWRTDPAVAYGGYFEDLASHGLDLLMFMLGDIEDVSGFCTNQGGYYRAMDSVTASWVHSGHVTGSGFWNFLAHQRTDRAVITGSEGRIIFSVFHESPVRLENGEGVTERDIGNPENIQLHHVQGIRDFFMNGRPHPSTGASALRANWVMARILGQI
ncbi:MAG: Gfo/Idh/MocA family oxidoreductase [Ketobacteraceae bacterium]|nr:Gfo/Idh/MocA family oxidoreductase [Ketobacteraceae bacterium]